MRGYLLFTVGVVIGTSGWQYADWRGRLYPRGLAQKDWLTYYSDRFQSVEVNNVFYRLPEKATFERWAAATPEDFVFSLKASRYLTHVLRLSKPTEPVRRLLESLKWTGTQAWARSCCSFQRTSAPTLPAWRPPSRPSRRVSEWRSSRVTNRGTPTRLRTSCGSTERRSASVTPRSGSLRSGAQRSGDTYASTRAERIRHPAMAGRPSRIGLSRLADLWDQSEDVYMYFNNDHGGCAVRDAHRFALAAEHAGLHPTRVPTSREASLTMEHA